MKCWHESPWREFTPVLVPGREFHEIPQRYHVNAKQPPISVWNQSAGRMERVVHVLRLQFWITCVFYQHEVYLQIMRNEMTQSPCKRDTKSKSHPSSRLAPVQVFSCKLLLRKDCRPFYELHGCVSPCKGIQFSRGITGCRIPSRFQILNSSLCQ